MQQTLAQTFPILEVSNGCIISKLGDYTVGFELTKPEIFTLSIEELDLIHQAWVKAIGLLPVGSVCHLQDWFYQSAFEAGPQLNGEDWLAMASDKFFASRPYLEHKAYLFLTRRPPGRKSPGPALNSLLRRNLVPEELLQPDAVQEFLDLAGRVERILMDSGLLKCRRLTNEELAGDAITPGVIEQYCQLSGSPGLRRPRLVRDLSFKDGIHIGEFKGMLYTLSDATQMPPQCGVGKRYAPYSSERTDLPIGFATGLGPLLPCNHVYSQYIFVEETTQLTSTMELKRRRLQSLSAHSRENTLTRQAVDDYLNEALSTQKKMVRAHFNVLAWTDDAEEVKTIRKDVATAISMMGANAHPETVSAAQIWWAGIPGNAGDMPFNECFTTFVEQAVCFLLPETNYRSSNSPFGIRLGDRITGKPVHTDISDEPMQSGSMNRNKFVLGGSRTIRRTRTIEEQVPG